MLKWVTLGVAVLALGYLGWMQFGPDNGPEYTLGSSETDSRFVTEQYVEKPIDALQPDPVVSEEANDEPRIQLSQADAWTLFSSTMIAAASIEGANVEVYPTEDGQGTIIYISPESLAAIQEQANAVFEASGLDRVEPEAPEYGIAWVMDQVIQPPMAEEPVMSTEGEPQEAPQEEAEDAGEGE